MMRSLFSGVSGLKVHQTRMDVIGNNIANVNTVGYKAQNVTFADIFYQTTAISSGPNATTGAGGVNAKQIGLGSTVGSISTNIELQGGSQRTDNPFDLMINGDSFFVVNKGGTNYFTKAGNFKIDADGSLVTSSGNQVMGWQPDETGTVVSPDRVSALQIMTEDNQSTPPEATTDSTIFGNINKESPAFSKPNEYDRYEPITMKFYDSLGYAYDATYHVKQVVDTGTGQPVDGQYSLNLFSINRDGKNLAQAELDEGATPPVYNYLNPSTGPVYFGFNVGAENIDAAGNITIPPGALTTVDTANPVTGYDGTTAPVTEYTFQFDSIATWVNADGVATTCPESLGGTTITLDLSKITNYGSKSTIDCAAGDLEGLGTGKAVGLMSGLGIDNSGKIIASYSNGDVRILGQIAVANFANPGGLEKVGDNLFAQTQNSGEFNGIGDDVTTGGGSFTSGVLEMSNVDLSSEFTDMITTQRGFQSNSRIITVSDGMLEELINLKR